VEFPVHSDFALFGKTGFSVEGWLYVDSAIAGSSLLAMNKASGVTTAGWQVRISDGFGAGDFSIKWDEQVSGTNANQQGEVTGGMFYDRWYHVIVTWKSDRTTQLYVDGIPYSWNQSDVAASGPIGNDSVGSHDLVLGYQGNGFNNLPLTGKIDNVAIYHRDLTAEEAAISHKLGLAGRRLDRTLYENSLVSRYGSRVVDFMGRRVETAPNNLGGSRYFGMRLHRSETPAGPLIELPR
jgi:hypothetical protein